MLSKLVETINPQPEDVFVEIGPGPGNLTELILPLSKSLHGVEIDPRMAPFLRNLQERHPNFTWEIGDFLKWEPSDPSSFRLIGNIPYNITSPLLFKVLDLASLIRDVHFLMDEAVARRLIAAPRTKAYGILSVFFQTYTQVQLLFPVKRGVFRPQPKVDSAFVRIIPLQKPFRDEKKEIFYRRLVRLAFNQRRKQLRNSLKPLLSSFDPQLRLERRPEELSPPEFLVLAEYLYHKQSANL